ncbi:MAG: restriction endonuclease subunit S [Euryarchaeota archaeon]|nr:restriction endonuclease subunit S [Euryarchaeota archaeon]MBU4220159.1 restriction endonuclease subunit S [Euryarchaeota archaeon]MBU4339726.1 restriction endonuclease subunit S [Euryarchaeota archaeon]MBU4453542.1 restriction endonuclease subunit S [Euryarchaeota archaeon]MCG2738096.1 restriction endonuclease subunit S [Candidatus Methanoperedenaceae archaeon]
MVSQWTTVTFGEVVRLEQGLCFNKKTNHLMAETGIPLLRIADLVNNTQTKFVDEERVPKKFIANPQDIIYSRTGQVGLVFKGKVGVVHNNCFRVIPKEGIERDYVYWYLRQPSIIQKARSLAGGAAQPDLGHDAFKSISFTYPELEIQRRIVGILSAYDDLIENNTQRIKILEEMAQALYREWFVKFRFPGHEKVRMVESELGMVPEGWEVKKATDAIYVNPTTKVPKEGKKPFVSMGNLSNDSMFVNSFEYRSGNSGSKFKNGDTLFARITPCLENGKTAYVQFLQSNNDIAFGSTEFIVLRSKTLCSELVYLMARSNEFRDNAIKSMSGATGRQRVQEACFDKFLFAHPDSKIISPFVEHVSLHLQNAYILNKKNANLRRTRDLLLPKLISGEVDVEKIDVRMAQ